MNYRGSYRKLLANSKAAMLAAIEIYNKPQMSYRDECFTILLVNAWELLAKAILSKRRQRIFYYQEFRGQPYRTYSLNDALNKARPFFPKSVPFEPVTENIKRLAVFRNQAIHFYGEPELGVLIYGFAQTCLVNYRDLVLDIFGHDITEEITFTLLPIGFGTSPDPVAFLRDRNAMPSKNRFVAEFIKGIVDVTETLEQLATDTGRFLTIYNVKLESVKKISSADLILGIDGASRGNGKPVLVLKSPDPNDTHPYGRTDVIERITNHKITTFTFTSIIWKYDIKKKKKLYLKKKKGGGAAHFGADLVNFIQNLSDVDVQDAVSSYKEFRKQRRKK